MADATSIQIRAARWGDLPEIARLLSLACWDDDLMAERLHPRRREHPADFDLYWLRQLRAFFWDRRSEFLVAVEVEVDGDDKDDRDDHPAERRGSRREGGRKELRIAGYAHWERKGDDEAARKMDLWRIDPRNLLQPLTKSLMTLHAHLYPNRAADPYWLTARDRSYAYFAPKYWSGRPGPLLVPRVPRRAPGLPGPQGRPAAGPAGGLARAEEEEGEQGVCASVIVALGKDGFYQKCGFEVQFGSAGEGEGNPLREVEGWNIWWKMPKPQG